MNHTHTHSQLLAPAFMEFHVCAWGEVRQNDVSRENAGFFVVRQRFTRAVQDRPGFQEFNSHNEFSSSRG